MTTATAGSARIWLLPVVAAGLLAVLALVLGPRALVPGWLAGWLFCVCCCIGASVWLMIHAVTGGRWLGAGRAGLARLAALTPLAALAGLPLLLAAAQLYPWWPGEDSARGALYLNAPAFLIRGAVMLGGWSLIGLFAARMGRGAATIGLIFHAVAVSFAGLDWILSRVPEFGSTIFGAVVAVLQLALALNAAALALRREDPQAVADWGGLMLAAVLGVFYLVAMEVLVIWSGNLPQNAAWYLPRLDSAGTAVAGLALIGGVVLPFLVLLPSRNRADPVWLRRAALPVLGGGMLYLVWLCAPGGMGAGLLAALSVPALLAPAWLRILAAGRCPCP